MTTIHPYVGAKLPGPNGVQLQLTRILGGGAFGIVFEATPPADSTKRFAVKFLQTGALADESERHALLNEIIAAREVRHENVLAVLHVSRDDHPLSPYIVSEFADGGNLHQRILMGRQAKSQIPLGVLRDWVFAIAKAMQAINAKVLHRDVKPDNILLSGDQIRVADFGLAKLVGDATRSVTFKGGQHVLYMAPEAWAGKHNEIQLDMYSVGLVFYELATLRYPYSVPTDLSDFEALRQMHVLGVAKNPQAHRSELPTQFAEVVLRLMAKRPEARYSTWQDVITALEKSFKGEPSENAKLSGLAESLAQKAHARYQRDLADQLEKAEEARRQKEEEQINERQQEEIVDRFRALVDAFNQRSEGPRRASVKKIGERSYTISFPYAQEGRLDFFSMTRPIKVRGAEVRYAGLLKNTSGCGYNFLLLKRVAEQYGTWVIARVRSSPFASHQHRCPNFGFGAEQMHEIETALQAMHVYVVDLQDNLDADIDTFVEALFSPDT